MECDESKAFVLPHREEMQFTHLGLKSHLCRRNGKPVEQAADHKDQGMYEVITTRNKEKNHGFVGKRETGKEMAQQVHSLQLSLRYSLN